MNNFGSNAGEGFLKPGQTGRELSGITSGGVSPGGFAIEAAQQQKNKVESYLENFTGEYDEINRDFNVAIEGQKDVLVKGEDRVLLVPNDERFREFTGFMTEQDASIVLMFSDAIENLPHDLVALEIPRDSRNLLQVVESTGTDRVNSCTIFENFARLIGSTANKFKVIPDASSLRLQSILFSREHNAILLTPSFDFIPHTSGEENKLLEAVHSQLLPEYKNQGGVLVFNTFSNALKEVRKEATQENTG